MCLGPAVGFAVADFRACSTTAAVLTFGLLAEQPGKTWQLLGTDVQNLLSDSEQTATGEREPVYCSGNRYNVLNVFIRGLPWTLRGVSVKNHVMWARKYGTVVVNIVKLDQLQLYTMQSDWKWPDWEILPRAIEAGPPCP